MTKWITDFKSPTTTSTKDNYNDDYMNSVQIKKKKRPNLNYKCATIKLINTVKYINP